MSEELSNSDNGGLSIKLRRVTEIFSRISGIEFLSAVGGIGSWSIQSAKSGFEDMLHGTVCLAKRMSELQANVRFRY